METFEQAWAKKIEQGFQYGPDALAHVRFGWNMRALIASDFTIEDVQVQPLALLMRSYIEAREALDAIQPRQRGFGFSKPDHAAIGVATRRFHAVHEQLNAALNATLTKGE